MSAVKNTHSRHMCVCVCICNIYFLKKEKDKPESIILLRPKSLELAYP